jgi:PKHD-type hydroxylase
MLVCLPGVLTKDQVAECRKVAECAEWIDGNATAGQQSALVKHNMQLREDSPEAKRLGNIVLDALAGNQLFISAALPLKIFPPLFNRYQGGESFGTHVDSAIRAVRGTTYRVRTDLSATLFLSEPEDYDGGELTVEGAFGAQEVKLPAGDMVLYPASSLHHVKPVSRGARLASFFWLQSMVRDDGERTLLFDLDNAIQDLARDQGLDHPVTIRLTGIYHNLLRRWADA